MANSHIRDLTTFVNEMGFVCTPDGLYLNLGVVYTIQMPYVMNIERTYASVSEVPTVDGVVIKLKNNGSDILNGNLIVGTNDLFGESSTFMGGGNYYQINKGNTLTVEITSLDSGRTAKGLKVYLIGHREDY